MDSAEIRRLYEQYAAALHRRAFAILKNEQSAYEVLQDVFVSVIQHADSFRQESSPYTWLYRITTNACLNHLKKHSRMTLIDPVADAHWGEMPDTKPTDLARLDQERFLKKLDDECRKIFIYRFHDGMGQEEIAGILKITRKTVYLKLEKIQEKLKRFLQLDSYIR